MDLNNLAWHRAVGSIIEVLDQDDFWLRLIRLLEDFVHFDSWVALRFSEHERPQVMAEMPDEDGVVDFLFEDYLKGLYLLDPFFIAAKERRKEGLIRLQEVAPDRFKSTEYYQRYFCLNIVQDEIQFNCLVSEHETLCLSLGSHRRFVAAELSVLSIISQWLVPMLHQRWRFEQLHSAPRSTPSQKTLVQTSSIPEFHFDQASLSTRESEISRLILSGFSSKGIAQRLSISVETVKVHRKHIYTKLSIGSQSELFALFLKNMR